MSQVRMESCTELWRKSGRIADLASGSRAGHNQQRCNTLAMLKYAWDEHRASSNPRKHGVSFQEGSTVFRDPLAIAVEDSADPGRILLLGLKETI
jgi:hypothetical protein